MRLKQQVLMPREPFMLIQCLNVTGVIEFASSKEKCHQCGIQDRCLAGMLGEAGNENAKEKMNK